VTVPDRIHVRFCPSYEEGRLGPAVRGLLAAGGLNRSGGRILVKPNLVRKIPVDRAGTTHPLLIVSVARALWEAGWSVLVADSPGMGATRSILEAAGCLGALEELGAEVRDLGDPRKIRLPSGPAVPLSGDVLESDALLNLPKWKTHCQVGFTIAVKNLYGCVLGFGKAMQHVRRGHQYEAFLSMLLDIAEVAAPRWTLVDGIIAMEGRGPLTGTPREAGFLFAGADPLVLDRVLSHRMGFESPRLFEVAARRGVSVPDPEEIPLEGDALPAAFDPPFDLPAPVPLTFHPLRRLFSRKAPEFRF